MRLHDKVVGTLEKGSDGWITFTYDEQYLELGGPSLSLSLPLREGPFRAEELPAYFSGLCSEGWLRRVQCFEQGIHPDDDFTLLIMNGSDLAGAVTILPDKA
ncbi:HipA N-terminal domain-containing protein [Marinobacter salicampi]|uniref:HipA N-terminal domain-containing protein n=1 Tax=Marinobacter salicampi TaxID=435907 RepID=UPI003BF87370